MRLGIFWWQLSGLEIESQHIVQHGPRHVATSTKPTGGWSAMTCQLWGLVKSSAGKCLQLSYQPTETTDLVCFSLIEVLKATLKIC